MRAVVQMAVGVMLGIASVAAWSECTSQNTDYVLLWPFEVQVDEAVNVEDLEQVADKMRQLRDVARNSPICVLSFQDALSAQFARRQIETAGREGSADREDSYNYIKKTIGDRQRVDFLFWPGDTLLAADFTSADRSPVDWKTDACAMNVAFRVVPAKLVKLSIVNLHEKPETDGDPASDESQISLRFRSLRMPTIYEPDATSCPDPTKLHSTDGAVYKVFATDQLEQAGFLEVFFDANRSKPVFKIPIRDLRGKSEVRLADYRFQTVQTKNNPVRGLIKANRDVNIKRVENAVLRIEHLTMDR